MRAQDKIGERNTLRKLFLSSIGCISFRVSFYEYDFSLPGYPARCHSFCRKRVETIRTNHGVLDISTIDASNCHTQIACFRTHAIEGFADEHSPAPLTDHRPSPCYLCRLNVRFILVQRCRLRRQAAHSSAIVPGCPSTFRTRPWTGCKLGTDAAPGLLRCSTSPDPPNHIRSRRLNLYGKNFGTIEPLGRSRCCLLLALNGQRIPSAVYLRDRLRSVHNCSGWKN